MTQPSARPTEPAEAAASAGAPPAIREAAPRVGLALSGGGFRAAAFHLGVLKRLEELGLLQRVEALSSVSGGSITGALYALRCAERGGAPGSYPVDALITEMRPFLTDNLRARALLGSPLRALQALGSVVSRRISRVGLMVEEMDRQLFGKKSLDQLPPWIAINATNLRTGKGWRFMHDRAGDGLAGATDRTNTIGIAEAVAASAAYPGLTDSFAFATCWEDMRSDLLSETRWSRPPAKAPGYVSRWRARYGEASGPVLFPLVDGGLYDNEGVNTLRSHQVTHAIISAVAPPASDTASGFSPFRWLRIVEVVHDRLGGATRQLAHEMTHGVHPTETAERLTALAATLRSAAVGDTLSDTARSALLNGAAEAEALSAVGTPPRGGQFTASAQVLLHQTDLAQNVYAGPARGGHDVPPLYRGLDVALVEELARVRTDLDALEPRVLDLLVAQGYFLADFMAKLTMPDLVFEGRHSRAWYGPGLTPDWPFAQDAVQAANANLEAVKTELSAAAARRLPLGRLPAGRRWIYRVNFALIAIPVLAALAITAGWLAYGAWKLAALAGRAILSAL